jgi:hypothetical protein
MDCEGGEYEIMQRLQEAELLHRVSIFLVEWHEAEEPVLLQYLKDFHCFYHKISPTTGIIRAVKTDAS